MNQDVLFSIVIPAFNRPQQLAECLRAISEVDFPPDRFEVVVADDGSTEPLRGVVQKFQGQLQVRLIEQPRGGPSTARNAGVRESRGRFIVFTDDDCRPAGNLLSALESLVAEWPDATIGGRTVNDLTDNIYSTASQDMVDFLIRYHHGNETRVRFFTTSNLTVSRETFERVGGFSQSFSLAGAEDRDFCERLVAHGIKFVFAPQVTVSHAHELTIRTFWQQHRNYGRGRFQLDRARTSRGSSRHFEKVGFYLSLVTDPVRRLRNWRGVKLSLLNALSQAAYAAGYFTERFSRS